jgi:hypothetical protein
MLVDGWGVESMCLFMKIGILHGVLLVNTNGRIGRCGSVTFDSS